MSRRPARPAREIPDTELIARTLAGDRDAYGELVGRYLDTSYAVAYALTGCRAESDDLVQDAFLGALQGLDRLATPAKFGAWLTGILRRLDANRRRTLRRRREVTRDYRDQLRSNPRDIEDTGDRDEELWQSIHGLPDELRVPLVLFYFEGESTAVVAQRLNLEPATARKRVQLARDRLRERLQTQPETPLARPDLQRLRPSRALRTAIALAVATMPFGATASAAVDPTLFAGRSIRAWREPFGSGFPIKVAAATLFAIGLSLLIVAMRQHPDESHRDRTIERPPLASSSASAPPTDRPSEASDAGLWAPELASASVDDSAGESPSVVVVTRVAHVRGTVRSADGSPLRCRQVFLGQSRQPWSRAESALLDEDGSFSFEVDNEEDRWIYLLIDHALVCPRDSWVRPSFSVAKSLEIIVEPGLTLSGVVVDDDGDPVRRARITLETPEPNQQGEALVETDRDGRFAITHLPAGEYQMSVSHAEHSRHLERLHLSRDTRRTLVLQPPRILRLTIDGLPAEARDAVIRFSLKARGTSPTTDPLANREELLFYGKPDSTHTLTLQAPPPGVWEGTFYRTLPKRRFELVIPEDGEEVHASVDLSVGAILSGTLRIDGGTRPTEVVLVDVSGAVGRGGQLIVPLDATGDGPADELRYLQTGIPPGAYLAGVKQHLAGHPTSTDQPEWILYGSERLQLDGTESHRLDLTLPTTQPVHVMLAADATARSTSYSAIAITPVDAPGFFTYIFEGGQVQPESRVGALALVDSNRVAVFDHLPPGGYDVTALVDGARASTVQISIGHASEPPVVVELSVPEFVRIELAIESSAIPARLRVQCPPAPTADQFATLRAWCDAYSGWLARATVRDRIDPRFARNATVHHFSRPYNDFAVGWHYWRSIVVRDLKFEGNLHVGSSGRATLEFPADTNPDTLVRIEADGFRALEMPARELFEYGETAVPLFLKDT